MQIAYLVFQSKYIHYINAKGKLKTIQNRWVEWVSFFDASWLILDENYPIYYMCTRNTEF